MTPALQSNYELYKSVSHTLLHVALLVSPFLSNPGSTAWHGPMKNYLAKVEAIIQALHSSTHLKRELPMAVLSSVSGFLRSCLEKLKLNEEEWDDLNRDNFWRIKECMMLATKEQADESVKALMKWKNKLGPDLWHNVYVVIPTVQPVARTNPRFEIFRNLLDEDRVETHIICSEYPRNEEEARTLLGRVVGDRAIGR